MDSLTTVCLFKKVQDLTEFTQYGWSWRLSRCLYLSTAAYLNLKLSHSDFLYLLDEEVPDMGAIAKLTIM